MPTTFAEAPTPLRKRMPTLLREIEVLRVAAQLGGDDFSKTAEKARTAVLKWTENRAGRDLPPAAWELQDFEMLAGGCNRAAVRIVNDDWDIWALRAEDADRDVPRRVWCTEIVVGGEFNRQPKFSLRLVASTPEREFCIDPSVPNIVVQMADAPGLFNGNEVLPAKPVLIQTNDDAQELCDYLEHSERSIPVFVTTLRDEIDSTSRIDSKLLAKATTGLARTYLLPEKRTWSLTDRLGRYHSVFHGGVRAYMPSFSTTDDPYRHRLFLGDRLQTDESATACVRSLRSLAAAHSISRTRLGKDVLDFSYVRTAIRDLKWEALSALTDSKAEMLKLTEDIVEILEKEIDEKDKEIDSYVAEIEASEARAQAAEQQNSSLRFYIQHLKDTLAKDGVIPSEERPLPEKWSEFVNWLDQTYPDKVVLTPAARRLTRSPAFDDVALVARSINWLASVQYKRRLEGGGRLANKQVESGVWNSHCGGDTYSVVWRGRHHDVKWHIKSGGNTHNPKRCLRIYYFWDQDFEQIVIDHLPSHRKTEIS